MARGVFAFLSPLLLIACLNVGNQNQNQKLNSKSDSQQKAYSEENEIIAQIFEDITGGVPLPLFLKISYGRKGAMTPVFSSYHWQMNHHLGTTYLMINPENMWNKEHLVHTKKMHEDGSGKSTLYLNKIEESFFKIPGARVALDMGGEKVISIPYFELTEPVNNTLRLESSQMGRCDGQVIAFLIKTAPISENQDQILKSYGRRKEKTAQLNACVHRVGNKINVLRFKVTLVKDSHSSLSHYRVSDIPQFNLAVRDK